LFRSNKDTLFEQCCGAKYGHERNVGRIATDRDARDFVWRGLPAESEGKG
jgi:hypothetical protein